MHSVGTYTVRDLRERTGELTCDAENGRLSLVTKHGRPLFLALPLSQELLEKGTGFALALQLYTEGIVTAARAAKLAGVTLAEFLNDVSMQGLPVVDYPVDGLDAELNRIG